jgi:hypothetical protein
MEARGDDARLNMYLLNHEGAITLFAPAPAVGDLSFNIAAGSAVTTGDMIELYQNGHVFQALVTNFVNDVGFDTVTVDTPLPYAFTVLGATGRVGTRNAAVDGAAPNVIFDLRPPTGHIWDVTRMLFYIEGNTAAIAQDLFGNLAALTNGVVLRVRRSAALYEHVANFKNNLEFQINSWEFEIIANMTAPAVALRATKVFGNEQNMGSMVRLNGTDGERLEVIVADDIDALDLVKFHVEGYILEDGEPV